MSKIRILELFAGIGACSKALENLGFDVEIVDAVEIDKYAINSFNAIHNTNFEVQDICKYNKDLNNIDIITHGSPCQDFSIAGKQAGGDIGSGTRSSLMYETIRIVGKLRPKYVLWENVKNILSKKHKHNFDNYINTMKALGYNSYYQVLNAKDYGIPQNRERVYTISIRNDIDNDDFEFPQKEELKIRLKDVLENEVDEKYYLSDKQIKGRLNTSYNKYKLEQNIINNKEIHPAILSRYDGAPTLHIEKEGIDVTWNKIGNTTCIARALTTACRTLSKNQMTTGVLENNLKIRKLTPKECWRLMGFNDEDFEKTQKVNSNTQLYKQAGNSIVVNVLMKIFRNLFKGGK